MPRVKVGKHYFLKYNAHVANEKLYFTNGLEIMLQQVTHGVTQFLDKRKKNCAICLDFSFTWSRLPHDKIHNNAYIICAIECS